MEPQDLLRSWNRCKTTHAMLDAWLASGDVPFVQEFCPTAYNPVKRVVIGALDDGEPVVAYGLQHMRYVESGTYEYYWKWLLDMDEALEQANVEIFIHSPAAFEWAYELNGRRPTPEDCLASKLVKPCTGDSFRVFRLLHYFGSGAHTVVFGRSEDVCKSLHNALLKTMRLPGGEAVPLTCDTRVPPVRSFPFAECPHCHQTLVCYEAMNSRGKLELFIDEKDAVLARAEAVKRVDYLTDRELRLLDELEKRQAQGSNELEISAFGCLTDPIHRAAAQLQDDPRFDAFRDALGQQVVEQFENVYIEASFLRLGNLNLEIFIELERLTEVLTNAIKAEHHRVLEKAERLQSLIERHLPSCPVCRTRYVHDMKWIEQLLIHESRKPVCACREDGSSELDLPEPFSEIRWLSGLRLPTLSVEGERGRWVETYRIDVNGRGVVRLAFDPDTGRQRFVLDRKALVETEEGTARKVDAWEERVDKVFEIWRSTADEMEEWVASGALLKLNLRYDARHQSWGDRVRRDGTLTVYAIRRGHGKKVRGAGWYYCQKTPHQPKSAPKPGFELVLVTPVLGVPLSRQAKRAS